MLQYCLFIKPVRSKMQRAYYQCVLKDSKKICILTTWSCYCEVSTDKPKV